MMQSSGSERRLIGSSATDGLLPCCQGWLAEQLIGEAKLGGPAAARPAGDRAVERRGDRSRPPATADAAASEPEP